VDLTGRLRKWALERPRVLVTGATGTDSLRWAAESELDRRGWVLAQSPCDADVLLILGSTIPQLSAAVDLVWGQIPQPRCRVEVID
jgi:Ni,Fe-hydrogenase III small subunit